MKGQYVDFSDLKRRLEKNRFAVSCFPGREEAARHLEKAIVGETVGFGGSVTLREMGLYERLAPNNTMLWHWVDPSARGRYAELTAYVTSVNAVAGTGELVNVESSGNRVSGSIFGAKRVYFVAGRNKIRPDLASAIERARNVAAPLNAKRLKLATPCVEDGVCRDCDSPARICGLVAIHLRPMVGAEHTEVILIDEDLGY